MKDELFIRGKVPMTKEEIRTLSLAKLDLHQAQNFLDIGTGTGSIAIEAALTYPQLEVTAIDSNPAAIELLQANQEKFQLTNVRGLLGKAPIDLPEKFDAIFVGGSGGNMAEIFEWSFAHLKTDGRLVLNFILLENALAAIEWLKNNEKTFDAQQVQIGRYQLLGTGHYYKPLNPVIIIETVEA